MAVVVRARRERAEHVEVLLDKLKPFASHAVVSWHAPGRSVPESYADALSAGCVRGAEWMIQLEDDIWLAPDFGLVAANSLLNVPSHVGLVSFFGTQNVLVPFEKLPAYHTPEILRGMHFVMAQAFAIRTCDVPSHNAFVLEHFGDRCPTDIATARWLASRGQMFMRIWPSIVQHGFLPSLSGHLSSALVSGSFDAAYGAPKSGPGARLVR